MLTRIQEAIRHAVTTSRVVATNQDVPIVIQYRAPDDTAVNRIGLVAVSANGDIEFYRGSTAASATLATNISGGASGKIDVSSTLYDTFGEVVDRINLSTATHGWRAMLVDCLRSDSANNTLRTRARTGTGVQSSGAELLGDTTVAAREEITVCLKRFPRFKPGATPAPSETGWQQQLRRVTGLMDFSTGGTHFRLYSRVGTRETEVLRFAGGADNVESTRDFGAAASPDTGFLGPDGGDLIVKLRAASAFGTVSSGYVTVESKAFQTRR